MPPAGPARSKKLRFTRSVGLPSAIALGSGVSVGVGVYVLLGQLIRFTDASTTFFAYLAAFAIAIPLILTTAERVAVLPVEDGLYGLARRSIRLIIPFFTGWLMLGGLASLAGLLGWGTAVYIDILLKLFWNIDASQLIWYSASITLLAVGFMLIGSRFHWQRYLLIILACLIFLAVIAIRGMFILDTSFLIGRTSSVALLDMTLLIAASFWSIHFVLSLRNHLSRPTRNVLRVLLINDGLRTLLGMAAAMLLFWYANDPVRTSVPLFDMVAMPEFGGMGFWPVTYGLAGLAICLIALRKTVDSFKELTDAMRADGFLSGPLRLPGFFDFIDVDAVHVLFLILAVAAVQFLAIQTVIELAAVGFLFSLAIALIPSIIASEDQLPENRRLKLPFHPLFPGVSIAISVLLPFISIKSSGMFWTGWIVAGTAIYFLRAKDNAELVRRESVVVEDAQSTDSDDTLAAFGRRRYRVVVGVSNTATMETLVRTGARIASCYDGELIVLKILSEPAYKSESAKREAAVEEFESIQTLIAGMEIGGAPISTIVRLASRPAVGILNAIGEENAALLLLGWHGELSEESRTPVKLLNDLVRYAECPVAIVRGDIPDPMGRLAVLSAGGPNAGAALQLAEKLAEQDENVELKLITINSDMEENEAQGYLDGTLKLAENPDRVDAQVVDAGSVEAGVAAAVKEVEVVILGMSKDDVSSRSYFGGQGVELLYKSETPGLLFRAEEEMRYRNLLRLADSVQDVLPNVTEDERDDVAQRMRVDAVPTVDFFVLIVLAAAIATLGLLQDSVAVIIGAMLVAPLMSPILAIAMAIVLGESNTLQSGLEATVKGIAITILVSVLMTLFSPFTELTRELFVRSQPTILDLTVALASGAAAGYAICRKEVSAALPGVAISAALVPPLCVVGYGIGISQFDIASGGMLLFVTNLVAIIVAAAVVFLAMGFHPPRTEKEEFRRNLWVSGLSLAGIFLVLAVLTVFTVQEANAKATIEDLFMQQMLARRAVVDDIEIERRDGIYYVDANIITSAMNPITPDEIMSLEKNLSQAADAPVEASLMVVAGIESEQTDEVNARRVEQYLNAALQEADVAVAGMESDVDDGVILLRATFVVSEETTITENQLQAWQEEMEVLVDQPVKLDISVVEGRRALFERVVTEEP